jgi:hypothetical protein
MGLLGKGDCTTIVKIPTLEQWRMTRGVACITKRDIHSTAMVWDRGGLGSLDSSLMSPG